MMTWRNRQRSSSRKHLLPSNFQEKIQLLKLARLGQNLQVWTIEISWLKNLKKTRNSEWKSVPSTTLWDMFSRELDLNSQQMSNSHRMIQKWTRFGIWTRLISIKLQRRSRKRKKLSLAAPLLILRTFKQSPKCKEIWKRWCQRTRQSWAQSNRSSLISSIEKIYSLINSRNWY